MNHTALPQIVRLRQQFRGPTLCDIGGEVRSQLAKLCRTQGVHPGASIAITAGSRGIANIPLILKSAVAELKAAGARPFIVPAMGSHGGATADGQRCLLASYGITEEFCGCPIRSGMETTVVGHTPEGVPVHVDQCVLAADHVLVCGRIKLHTDYSGPIQSGLLKMMLIGLGKHAGALAYHQAFHQHGYSQIVISAGKVLLTGCNVWGGLAIVENGCEQTALIEAVPANQMISREQELLRLADEWMARLPFDSVDLLIVDEIGKNISGTGMDTNVIGRKYNDHCAAPDERPQIKRIYVRGLTATTHGNAAGLGIAEFCSQRLLKQMNAEATRLNIMTSGHVTAGMIPLDYATDRAAITAALDSVGRSDPERARVIWISNTLDLCQLECSTAYLEEVRGRPDLEILTAARPFPFDADGNLPLGGLRALDRAEGSIAPAATV